MIPWHLGVPPSQCLFFNIHGKDWELRVNLGVNCNWIIIMTRLKTCFMESKQYWLMHIIILNLELGVSRACSTYPLNNLCKTSLRIYNSMFSMVSGFISWCPPVEKCIFVTNSSLARKNQILQVLKLISLHGI